MDRTAPCDHSGCESLALESQTDNPRDLRFASLVSLLLSSQTKDAVVGDAVRAMKNDGVLSVEKISQMPAEELNSYIKQVGFHNNKTKYLKGIVQILQDQYDGDIPPTADAMMQLPGIGPKMAYICENVAWKRVSGIGVDTHMHRLFNALGWVRSNTPEQTRLQLESWLPAEYWEDVNLLWVGFGQEVQQFKPKILRKALNCTRPADALRLLKRCGLDYAKEGAKLGLDEEIRSGLTKKGDLKIGS
jgi:endonuclease III